MTLDERQLAVGILLSITLVVRVLAQHQAGGLFRDQSDGLAREGGRAIALAVRIPALGALIALLAWLWGDVPLPGTVDLPSWAHWLALGLAQAGTILLLWVQQALGVQLSGTLHMREDHQLVRAGPYSRVRHPMYTAFVLLFAGIGLLVGSLPLLAVLLGTQVWTIGVRLPAEEQSLHERFGDAWLAHRRSTGALTPWL